tara:strand:- start:870 stop:1919 length:1050 start_codon:yes stop_codon:yes gene_type:complete
MKNFKQLCVEENITLNDSLKILKKTGNRCVLIVKKNFELKGSLTDGDIRKALLKKISLDQSITKIYNRKPKFILFNQKNNITLVQKLLLNLPLIPVIKNKKIISVIRQYDLVEKKPILKNQVDTVIMAGGKGTRLLPFTDVLPKPLIPINGTPIISHIINNIKKYNYNNFWISMNYKYSILKNYLNTEEKKTHFNFLIEKKSLGTVGSLSLIDKKKITENFYVTNCDILVNTSLKNFYNFHKKNKSLLTLIVTKKKMKFAYGACELKGKHDLKSIKEKPEHIYLVNTGFYIMNKKILHYLKYNKKTDINELIELLKKKNLKISCYTIKQKNWSDFGNWSQYNKELKNLT